MQTIYRSAFYLKVNYQKHNNANSNNKILIMIITKIVVNNSNNIN